MNVTIMNREPPKAFRKKLTDTEIAIKDKATSINGVEDGGFYGFIKTILYFAKLINGKYQRTLVCLDCYNKIDKKIVHECSITRAIPIDDDNNFIDINSEDTTILLTKDEITSEDTTILLTKDEITSEDISISNVIDDDSNNFEEIDDEEKSDIHIIPNNYDTNQQNLSINEELHNIQKYKDNESESEIESIENNILDRLNLDVINNNKLFQYWDDDSCEYISKLINKAEVDLRFNEVITAIKDRNFIFLKDTIDMLYMHFSDTSITNHFIDDKKTGYVLAFTKLIKNHEYTSKLDRFNYVPIGNIKNAKKPFLYTNIIGSRKYKLAIIQGKRCIIFENLIKIGLSGARYHYERFFEHLKDIDGLYRCFERSNNNKNNEDYGVIPYTTAANDNAIRIIVTDEKRAEEFIKSVFLDKKNAKKAGYKSDNKSNISTEIFLIPGTITIDHILNIIPQRYHKQVNNRFNDIINNNQSSRIIYDNFLKPIMTLVGSQKYIQLEYNKVLQDLLDDNEYVNQFTSIGMHHHDDYKLSLSNIMKYFNDEFKKIDVIKKNNDKLNERIKPLEAQLIERDSEIAELESDKEVLKAKNIELTNKKELYSKATNKFVKILCTKKLSYEEKKEINIISEILISSNSTSDMISDIESDSDSE